MSLGCPYPAVAILNRGHKARIALRRAAASANEKVT